MISIKWFGTAAISYTHADTTIIFDPFCGLNKKLGCFTPEELAAQGDIFITHGHFDHLADVPAVLAKGKATVHCSQITADHLINSGVNRDRIKVIAPGQNLTAGAFNIHVLKGKHIDFDRKLVVKTILNFRVLRYSGNFFRMLKTAKEFPEGQTLIYIIEVDGKRIMHMGSLDLAAGETYPQDVDILMLPFQGRSDLSTYALPFITKIKPKSIYLHHFDDSFPPLSRTIETGEFIRNVRKDFPEMKFIIPQRGEAINI
jgi:L-ascorbate metabolism protein UlaG (beta-lactamase superfamily)